MAQHYNKYSTTGSPSPQDSSTHNVPEDFDLTNFLLRSRPPDGNADELASADTSWPHRVQDVKSPPSGNSLPSYGLPESNAGTGWSAMGSNSADLRGDDKGASAAGMYSNSRCWAPGGATVGSPVYPSVYSNYNSAANLTYSSGDPVYDPNLSRIWGGDGALFGQRGMDATSGATTTPTGVDYGTAAATDGRDMYEYAWNEWERPLTESSNHSNATSPVKNRNTTSPIKNRNTAVGETAANRNHEEGGVEELRSAFFGGRDRRNKSESSVSAHSTSSWPSKGNNASVKDGCSSSSKTFSDVTKEGKQPGRGGTETHGMPKSYHHPPQSSNVNKESGLHYPGGFQASSSSFKPPSHYNTVTPPPGFEASPLHMPQGTDSLDEFLGTSAKVQQWLQRSRHSSESVDEASGVLKQTASKKKKKKKSKKVDPLAGSVASFIRDYNSVTSESTDPSSVDETGRTPVVDIGADKKPTESVEHICPTKASRFCHPKCSFQEAPAPANKDEKLFFDPKRIFQESSAKKPLEKKTATKPVKIQVNTASASSSYFDPKRIFQARATDKKDDEKLVGSSEDKLDDNTDDLRGNESRTKSVDKENATLNSGFSTASDYNSTTRTTPLMHNWSYKSALEDHIEQVHSAASVQDLGGFTTSPPPPQMTKGSGDNRPIKNKGSACSSGGGLSGAYSGVESINLDGGFGGVDPSYSADTGRSGTRPDMSEDCATAAGSQSQNAKSKHTSTKPSSEEFAQSTKGKRKDDMRTRSQCRREEESLKQRHYVPGDGDGVHTSKATSSHQDCPSAKEPPRHNAFNSLDDMDDDLDSPTFAKDTNSNASNYSIPNVSQDKSGSRHKTAAPSSSAKHPGRTPKESQPGWKRNKSSKNSRSESRTGKTRRDLPRQHGLRSESPAGSTDRNGAARVHGRHRETAEKGGRYRQDSDGTKSENAAHYYDADQFYQWMKAIVHFAIWVCGFVSFLILVLVAYFYSTCKVWIEYMIHIARELWLSFSETLGINSLNGAPRWWTQWLFWFRWKRGSNSDSRGHDSADDSKQRHGKQADFVELPTTSSEAIKRIMACDAEDAYAVLGVADRASDEDIKKYYRKQCVMVHPDKCNLRHANDAFQRLQKGYETLTDPMKRYELDRQRASAVEAEDMIKDIYEKMQEAMNTLNCNMCENKHKRYPMDRPCYEARYCRRCETFHGATEGDMWAETTHMGFKWHYYACMEDAVYDITEWAKCQNLSHMEANACEVRYRIGSNKRRQPGPFVPPRDGPPRHQHPQHPPPGFEDFGNGDGELDDLLRHLFGDRNNRTANDPRMPSGAPGYNNTSNSGRSSNRKRRHRHKKY